MSDDKDRLFYQILDLVGTYCESYEDFQYIINNITVMQENFCEEGDEDEES